MSVENIRKLADKFTNIELFLSDEVVKIANNTAIAELIANLNRGQMAIGINADSTKIGNYTDFSRKMRAEKSLQYAFIDLKQTGDFYKSVKSKAIHSDTTPTILITSSDPKWNGELGERFSSALGLTEENRMIIAGEIARKLSKSLSKYLQI